MNNYIYIGKIVDTHGIKGEIRIRSDFEKKNDIFIPGFKLYIGDKKISETINTYRHHKEYEMVIFDGYDNINQILKYMKQNVYIRREDLLKNNEYVLEDLIGLNVYENDELLGQIKDYVYNRLNVLLVVSGKKDFYIPYNKEYIKEVKINDRVITNNAKDLIL